MRNNYLASGICLLILIASHSVAAEEIKVFLLGGQSNMLGRASNSGLPVALQGVQDDVLLFGGSDGTAGITLESLRPDGKSGSEFGPEVTFGRTIADTFPDTTFAIIKYAAGGTDLDSQWSPSGGGGLHYNLFKQTVANGLVALQGAGYTADIIGMLWYQGESDASDADPGGAGRNYEANLNNFIADMRSNYRSDLPFMIGEINRTSDATNAIADAQAAVGSADPDGVFVPAADLFAGNNIHLGSAGMITLGERFALQYTSNYASLVPEPSSAVLLAIASWCALRRRPD